MSGGKVQNGKRGRHIGTTSTGTDQLEKKEGCRRGIKTTPGKCCFKKDIA